MKICIFLRLSTIDRLQIISTSPISINRFMLIMLTTPQCNYLAQTTNIKFGLLVSTPGNQCTLKQETLLTFVANMNMCRFHFTHTDIHADIQS